jgi:dynein assembly factor 1
MISKVEGLGNLPMLDTIQLKRNRIGRTGGLSDVLGLLECPTLTCVDISDNYIDDEAILPEVWMKMPKILVIYMQGNGCTKKIKNYRKTVISSIPDLRYLDDRPVFEDDRAFAEAWARGGIEEERKERERIRKDKEEKHWKNHEAFQDMINRAREEKRQADEAKKAAQRAAIEAEGGAPEVVEEEEKPESAAAEEKPEEEKQAAQQEEDDEEPPELEQVDMEEEKRI